MDEEKKITKIVVNKEDELTDLVSSILEAPNERIVLTFAEETDLLISPINLKVLLETADEREKLLVAQIIKNPTGLRNANLAGLTTIDTPSFPEEEVWEKEQESKIKRLAPSKKEFVKKEIPVEEEPDVSDFKRKIDEAIERNKEKVEGVEQDENLFISLDEDIPVSSRERIPQSKEQAEDIQERKEEEIEKEPDLSSIDFRKKTEEQEERREARKAALSSFTLKVKDFFKKIPLPDKFKKIAPIIGLSVVLLLALITFIYINTAVIAKVEIYIEAKEVEIEEVFQGDENIKEIDFENFKIPIKTENIEKARSTNINATGTAFKGEKARGPINIVYPGEEECTSPLELQAGSTLTSVKKGLSYTLDSAVSISCGSIAEGAVTALEVGDEYNLPEKERFTFQGFSGDSLFALNSNKAFSGGSKKEYTVLSKADVDAGVNDLKGIAIEEGESELKNKNGNWKIIPDSVVSEVVQDSTKTGVAIGAEATQTSLSIKTKSSATFFLKEGFDKAVKDLLTQKAKDENLFESDSNGELELDKDIEKDISVVENDGQTVRIRLFAKGLVKPKVEKEAMVNELKNMTWEEGNKYLENLKFSDKDPKVEFLPDWFPESFRRFPKRRGGIMITIKDVK